MNVFREIVKGEGVTWVAPRWSLSSARIDTSSGAHPHTSREGVGVLKSRGTVCRVCVYSKGKIERRTRPWNGRGRRECWRAATRRLKLSGLLLPSPTYRHGQRSGDQTDLSSKSGGAILSLQSQLGDNEHSPRGLVFRRQSGWRCT